MIFEIKRENLLFFIANHELIEISFNIKMNEFITKKIIDNELNIIYQRRQNRLLNCYFFNEYNRD